MSGRCLNLFRKQTLVRLNWYNYVMRGQQSTTIGYKNFGTLISQRKSLLTGTKSVGIQLRPVSFSPIRLGNLNLLFLYFNQKYSIF